MEQQTNTPQTAISAREQWEQKKAEKEAAQKNLNQKRQFTAAARWLLVAGIGIALVGGIVYVFTSSSQELGPDYSHAVPFEGATHVTQGDSVIYQSNPPTSGPHWPTPLRSGIYDEEKPDEAIVHSLEHGRVWISYQPSISQQVIDQLKNIASEQPRVVLTPRAANETNIALAAWTQLDIFNLGEDGAVDENRILDFIRRYRDKGPEGFIPSEQGTSDY